MTTLRRISIAIAYAAYAVCAVLVGATATALAAQSAPSSAAASQPSKATLADVAFIAGIGSGALGGGTIDEHWAPPSGDSMMGMFRYVKDGKAVFYEFLLIEQTASGPVLRLKHFNPGLIGREEKAEVYSYDLVDLQPRRAVFERPDKQTRLIFDGTADRKLAVTLDQMKNGAWQSQKFVYDHAPASAPSSSR